MGIAMRRTLISLAIVALLLCGQSFGQAMGPQGESLAPGNITPIPGAIAPVPQVGQPSSGMALSAPELIPPAPQPGATPQLVQPPTTYQVDPSMMQPPAMPGGPTDPSCISPGCALCGVGTARPKDWYVDQRVRIMTHPRPRKKTFGAWRTVGLNNLGQLDFIFTPATDSRSTPFDLSSSYEVTLGRYLGLDTYNRDHFLEFTFYGTNHWGAAGSVLASEENQGFLDAAGNIVSSADPWVIRCLAIYTAAAATQPASTGPKANRPNIDRR